MPNGLCSPSEVVLRSRRDTCYPDRPLLEVTPPRHRLRPNQSMVWRFVVPIAVSAGLLGSKYWAFRPDPVKQGGGELRPIATNTTVLEQFWEKERWPSWGGNGTSVQSVRQEYVRWSSLFDGLYAHMEKEPANRSKAEANRRCHPRLIALDTLVGTGLSYCGWRNDVKTAEQYHVAHQTLFFDHLRAMRAKHALHVGDRSHPQLIVLDSIVGSGLSYSGWKTDVQVAENLHVASPDAFYKHLKTVVERQQEQIREDSLQKDRSHPRLVALDTLVGLGLSYSGWQKDLKQAHCFHVHFPLLFSGKLEEMTRKHALGKGDRSHLQLVALDALIGSGLGHSLWQRDVKTVEEQHIKGEPIFYTQLQELQAKQEITARQHGLRSDRSHPHLVALDALVGSGVSYPGWRGDVKKAEELHVQWPILFNTHFQAMMEKQEQHTRSKRGLCLHCGSEIDR